MTKYGIDSGITQLVDTYDWLITPISNPDGYIYSWTNASCKSFLLVLVLIMTCWVYRIACGARIADRSTIPRASEWIRTETLTRISAESEAILILAPKLTPVRPLSPRPNHEQCVTFCWLTVDESKLPCPSIPTPSSGSHLTDSPQSDRPIMRKW